MKQSNLTTQQLAVFNPLTISVAFIQFKQKGKHIILTLQRKKILLKVDSFPEMCKYKLTCVDDPLRQDGAELRHHVLVLVHDHLRVQSTEILDPRAGRLGLLDQYHRRGDQCALADEVHRIVRHRIEQRYGFLQAGSRTRDS